MPIPKIYVILVAVTFEATAAFYALENRKRNRARYLHDRIAKGEITGAKHINYPINF